MFLSCGRFLLGFGLDKEQEPFAGILQELPCTIPPDAGGCIVVDYCAIIGLNQKDLENQGILA